MKKILTSLIIALVPGLCLAQDWANLKHFQAANATLDTPKADENRVVFMGNSITEHWRKGEGNLFTNPSYINRGISGQTTPQMLLRFRQDVIALEPKVVVILAGINDIAENTGPTTIEAIADNIKSMADLATMQDIKVVLCSTLPAYRFPWRPGIEPAEKVIALNAIIKAYAQEQGHIYLDYFTPMADERHGLKAAFTYDEVHPTEAGYLFMEPLVEAAIAEVLKEEK